MCNRATDHLGTIWLTNTELLRLNIAPTLAFNEAFTLLSCEIMSEPHRFPTEVPPTEPSQTTKDLNPAAPSEPPAIFPSPSINFKPH